MNILILGATGFIGSAITKALISQGHAITVCVRDLPYAQTQFPNASFLNFDEELACSEDYWMRTLSKIDIVINCLGVFNTSQQERLHTHMPMALFSSAKASDIKLCIQISALGVETSDILYATSKKAADDFLLALNMPAVILRPSLVYASGSYGGTSLFRAMASLPFVLPTVGSGQQLFQPIHINELVQSVCNLVNSPPTKPVILNATGKDRISLRTLLSSYRSWLGFKKALNFRTPLKLIKWVCQLGDKLKSPVINKTAYSMLSQDNVSSEAEVEKFQSTASIRLKSFQENLYSMPSYVQDRWQAKLYFLRPLLRIGIGMTWLFSGIVSLIAYKKGLSFLTQLPLHSNLHWPLLISASCLDILLGLGSLLNYKIKKISSIQIFVIILYSLIISIFLPILWLDPFGAVLKNGVIIIATLILMAISDLR